jgi:hypothetical protein
MGWLQKLLRRQPEHEQWLSEHPGKESMSAPPPGISEDEARRMRSQMESEMDDARSKREKE